MEESAAGVATERDPPPSQPTSGATQVALGIAVSRAFGFLREVILAFFFGAGPHADVFRTALRGPNILQNLLGEQTLSASFIPVYSRLLAAGKREEAGRFAGAIFGLLLAVAASLSLIGIVLAEPIVGILAPGYLGDSTQVAAGGMEVDRYRLAVTAVRIIFPMTGVLVLSAWALGVLNSHRRFLVPYMAPALWNAAIIGALVVAAYRWDAGLAWVQGTPIAVEGLDRLVVAACVGALIGGVLQFSFQLPAVAQLLRGFRLSISPKVGGVSEALNAFAPLVAGRGAVQLSSYLDYFLGSFLAAGAVAALGWAQTLYLLPIGLFGMSVAAAELPELARRSEAEDRSEMLGRIDSSLRQMAFLTVPTAVGYLVFGFLLIGGLFRRGQFGVADNWLVYLVLCGYSSGLLASTTSRLLNNVFYSFGQTKVPARIAIERVVLSAVVGISLMLWLDHFSVAEMFGTDGAGASLFLGAVGLSLGAGVSSWYELARLQVSLKGAVGSLSLPWAVILRFLAIAALSCVPAAGLWYLLRDQPPLMSAVMVLAVYTLAYLALTWVLGLSELGRWLGGRRGQR